MSDLLKDRYKIFSEKHGITGIVTDHSIFCELSFCYHERQVTMSIKKPFPFSEESLKKHAKKVLETYIERMHVAGTKQKLMLHYWYIQKEAGYLLAWGNVSGHRILKDTSYIHTSAIEKICVDEANEELILETRNSKYHCPLEYCNFSKQDQEPEHIPEYLELRNKYAGKRVEPSMESGNILLVLSNYDDYYFHSLYYQPVGEEEPLKYSGYAHIGMFQDSYLISTEKGEIDFRYFPGYQNIQFYSESVNESGTPWFIENIGDTVLFAETSCGVLQVNPGERLQVRPENAMQDKIELPKGDLYPPEIVI